jgi:hypothetical protein
MISARQTPSYGGDWGFTSPLPWQLRLAQVVAGLEAWAVPLAGVALALPRIVTATVGSQWGSLDVIEEWPAAVLFLLGICAVISLWFAAAIHLPHRAAAFWLVAAVQAGLLAAALLSGSPAFALIPMAILGLLLVPASRHAALGHSLPAV